MAGLSIPTSAAAQSEGGHHYNLPRHDDTAKGIEAGQILKFRNDPNVIYKLDSIHNFYGIKREDVLLLPGEHPSPDVYEDLVYTDDKGRKQSCCHGRDCRPAIFRGIGNGKAAVGLRMYDSALFFLIDMKDVQVFSKGTLMPGNEKFLKHDNHACVVGGRIQCVVLESEG